MPSLPQSTGWETPSSPCLYGGDDTQTIQGALTLSVPQPASGPRHGPEALAQEPGSHPQASSRARSEPRGPRVQRGWASGLPTQGCWESRDQPPAPGEPWATCKVRAEAKQFHLPHWHQETVQGELAGLEAGVRRQPYNPAPAAQAQAQAGLCGPRVSGPTHLMFSVTLEAGLECQWWTSWPRCYGRFRVVRWLLEWQVHSRGTQGILSMTGS